MKEIILSTGKVTQVDDIDYDFANQYSWWEGGGGYAYATIKQKAVALHHLILQRMGVIRKEDEVTDHRDQNRLNNQRLNLRVVTQSQNLRNSDSRIDNPTRGTSYHSRFHNWRANISIGNCSIHLGCFNTQEEAIEARRKAEITYGVKNDYLPR